MYASLSHISHSLTNLQGARQAIHFHVLHSGVGHLVFCIYVYEINRQTVKINRQTFKILDRCFRLTDSQTSKEKLKQTGQLRQTFRQLNKSSQQSDGHFSFLEMVTLWKLTGGTYLSLFLSNRLKYYQNVLYFQDFQLR